MKYVIDSYNTMHTAVDEMCAIFKKELVSEQALFVCRLVASELLSNVLQHGGEQAYFEVQKTGDKITISVQGRVPYRPPEKSVCADVLSDGGRGLFLIDTFCESRDYTETDGTRVVIKI